MRASREPAGPLPRGVLALGLVSLCMDLSSEAIHSLLPLFLVGTLGASALVLGAIEGVAEATAAATRLLSGALSDRWRRRKPLVLGGYGLAAVTKPLFPLADGVATVLAARLLDRLGKGVRGAPRDAWIADLTPVDRRGEAYGLRQTLDTVGAVLGPVLAIAGMALLREDIRLVFWIAAVPAFLSVALVALAVHEPGADERPPRARGLPLRRAELAGLDRRFWLAVAFAGVLTLARFSEAFLVLRAPDCGLAPRHAPLVLVAMNLAYAASAWPAGWLSDRLGRRGLLALGVAALIAADLVLAAAASAVPLLAGAALWGLHMGTTQGLLAALVASHAPAGLRGTAFGLFHLTSSLALLLASLVAGALWSAAGPRATYLAGAAFAVVALAGLVAAPHEPRES